MLERNDTLFIYITYDSDGYITDFKKEKADGYTKVYLLDTWLSQFTLYSDKFRFDTTKQQILNPGNLPTISTKQLVDELSSVQHSISSGTTDLSSLQDLVDGLQQSISELTLLATAAAE